MPGISTGFSAVDGTLTERQVDYCEALAKGGLGLLIVDVSMTNTILKNVPWMLGLMDDGQIIIWS